jgi:hypothetical protein
MQRTIYDFLYRKYELAGVEGRNNTALRSRFAEGMKLYWGVKLAAVAIYLGLFLYFVGSDRYLPSETYWFIGGVAASLILITLAYMNVFTAWFAIMLGKHRMWFDRLLIITGLVLCIKLPVYTFGESAVDFQGVRQSLVLPGILMIAMGVYRKVHYKQTRVVHLCAAVSVVISAGILAAYPLDMIGQSVYLGFILLLNAGFIVDLIVYYGLHYKSRRISR